MLCITSMPSLEEQAQQKPHGCRPPKQLKREQGAQSRPCGSTPELPPRSAPSQPPRGGGAACFSGHGADATNSPGLHHQLPALSAHYPGSLFGRLWLGERLQHAGLAAEHIHLRGGQAAAAGQQRSARPFLLPTCRLPPFLQPAAKEQLTLPACPASTRAALSLAA